MQQDLSWWKAAVITTMTTASVSFVASSALSIKIASSLNGLHSPYRRLIFGLSISDVMQSVALITAVFSTPESVPQAIWGMGNRATCAANGFFFCMGMGCMPMYFCAICYYYLCKLKKNMTDDAFSKGMEWKIHAFIILVNISICIAAIATKTMNSSVTGTFCTIATFPTGCRQQPELYGECDEKIAFYSSILLPLSNLVIPFLSLVGVIINMTLLCSHVLARDRIYRASAKLPGETKNDDGKSSSGANKKSNDSEASSSGQDSLIEDGLQPIEVNVQLLQQKGSQVVEADDLRRLYRKETMVQACWYCLSYTITFGPLWMLVVTAFIVGKTVSDRMLLAGALFYPLGGLFNILVFTRPAVANLRRRDPQIWWLKAFWLVFKAGGQVPKGDRTQSIKADILSCNIENTETSIKFKVAEERHHNVNVHSNEAEVNQSLALNGHGESRRILFGEESSFGQNLPTGVSLSENLQRTDSGSKSRASSVGLICIPTNTNPSVPTGLSLADVGVSTGSSNLNNTNSSLYAGLSEFESGIVSENNIEGSIDKQNVGENTQGVIRDAFAAALQRVNNNRKGND